MSFKLAPLLTSYISNPSFVFFNISTLQKLLSYKKDASVMIFAFCFNSSFVFSIITFKSLLNSTSSYFPNSPFAKFPTAIPFSKTASLAFCTASCGLYFCIHNFLKQDLALQYLDFERLTLFIIFLLCFFILYN